MDHFRGVLVEAEERSRRRKERGRRRRGKGELEGEGEQNQQSQQGLKEGLERVVSLGVERVLRLGEQRGRSAEEEEEDEEDEEDEEEEEEGVVLDARRGLIRTSGEEGSAGGEEGEEGEEEQGKIGDEGHAEDAQAWKLVGREDIMGIQTALDEFLRDVLVKTAAGSSPGVEWFLKRRESDCIGP